MIGFDDHIRLTKALDEAARLRARVKKLEAQLFETTVELNCSREESDRLSEQCTKLTVLVRKMGESMTAPIMRQIIILMEKGYRNIEIIRMGYSRGSVENTRRKLRDANNT